MRTLIFILAIAVSFLLVASCENNENIENQPTLTGKLISNTTCKLLKSATNADYFSDTLSCIEYAFDSKTSLLAIRHINAGFNCCPDSLFCDVSINNNSIVIQEFENKALCKCNCLYDLNIELTGVEAKKYQVIFIEPYSGEGEKINFDMDLTKNNAGTYCVTRKHYPWGILNLD